MDSKSRKKPVLKILCLEDSPVDAELIYEYLCENSSYELQMHTVSKEADFISAITSEKYDLILSDFTLPGFNGFAALKHVKAVCPNTPFICVSGYIGEEVAVELLKQGSTDYVAKDKLGRLIYAIERALKESEEREEKEKRAAELMVINKELVLQNKEIVFLSHHDFSTNLYNRIYFETEKKRLDTARQLSISIIMGDINGLKLITDGFGHQKGDEVLVEVAKILKSCCREEDIISRIGGDEFGILLPRTDSQIAQLICSRIAESCKSYVLKADTVYPSISMGHATKINTVESIDDVFRSAEESMYRQKLLERKSAHSSIMISIKATMLERSHETAEHAERLISLTKSIGLALKLDTDHLNKLELLASLHDIGKMGISDNILSKSGKLNDEEWVEMRKHPEVGFRIAQATSELIPIANYVLCHHERWDGKGYPQGLTGENIPLLSRIISIADSYDAMTNERPYRLAMTKGEAMEEIERNCGTQFDPEIGRIFIEKVLEQEREQQQLNKIYINV